MVGREEDPGANLDGAKPGVGWQGPLQRLNNLKICPYHIYGAARLALTGDSQDIHTQGSFHAG